MKQIKMGCTTLDIPAMALGIMRMDKKSIPEAQVAIQAAYDSDINFIDSADIYGGGKSEEVFGQALKQMNLKREDLFIQSKTGIVPGKRYDFSKEQVSMAFWIEWGSTILTPWYFTDLMPYLIQKKWQKPSINFKLVVKYVSSVFPILILPNLNCCKIHSVNV